MEVARAYLIMKGTLSADYFRTPHIYKGILWVYKPIFALINKMNYIGGFECAKVMVETSHQNRNIKSAMIIVHHNFEA
jgi:hypothetical protein